MNIPQEIRRYLREVQVPGRYLGIEKNAVKKTAGQVRYRIALCYPDTYEVGMSHLGLAILYHLANEPDDQYAERCFAPWPDMARVMKDRKIPLFSLETCTPLRQFDFVGFSLQHELLYTNVLYMLDLAGIPLRSADRGENDPIVAAGGNGALTPEPMAEAIDLYLPGDGEATLPGVLALFKRLKTEGRPRHEALVQAASRFPFVYVPALYKPQYNEQGDYQGLKPLHGSAPVTVQQGLVEDLDECPIPKSPIVPGIRCIHERITLEIMRGCTRGCRFCQAGMTRRPLRTRSPESLVDAARKVYAATGHDEISLCSLSSADYPDLDRLVTLLNERFEPLKVGISLPSLRVDEKLKKLPSLAAAVRKAGLTVAPEAATEKLRKTINKDISDRDLEEAALTAYEQGWRRMKLYFMIGLPGETDDDVRAIVRLALYISNLRKRFHKGPAQITVSVSTFVPKAHTPFQWCPMDRPETVRHKHRLLLSTHPPRTISF
ncbi:MAG: TIGR03960 family B12-binding radical SAM protein, partial [Planctomycetes bacterium]|nr:TIGR03960 family B12-binding radical SAM protein [Planctomycetota bacterium]